MPPFEPKRASIALIWSHARRCVGQAPITCRQVLFMADGGLTCFIFGCRAAALRSTDVKHLDKVLANCVTAAFGLPRSAHHSALLDASGIPKIQEELRGAII